VLDAVLVEAKAIDGKLSADDRRKLDEDFQSIREIETRLAKDEAWMTRPKPRADLTQPHGGLAEAGSRNEQVARGVHRQAGGGQGA
jgi:hypothetical protein